MSIGLSAPLSLHELADYELIEQTCAGDQQAFEALVSRYQGEVYRFIKRHMGTEQAYDVLQFVLLQLYLSMPHLQSNLSSGWQHVSLKRWIFRVAWNRCIDEQRKRKKSPLLFSELMQTNDEEESLVLTLLDTAPQPEEVVEQHDLQESIQKMIQRLPPMLRAVMWLRYKEELSFNEIGERLQIPSATAKTYCHRARLRLRSFLANQARYLGI